MKRLSFFSAGIVLSLVAAITKCAGAEPAAPQAADVLQQLFRQSNLKIGKMKYCDGVFQQEQDHTLGRYLAELTSNMVDAGDNQVRYSCEAAKPSGWTCDLMFQHNIPQNEIMFSYGVRVSVDRKGTVNMKSLSCIGAG